MEKYGIIRQDLTPEQEMESEDKQAAENGNSKVSLVGAINKGTENVFVRLLEADGVDSQSSR